MPRKRVIDITESLDELRRLAADNAGTPTADPIRMLIALKKNPTATTNDIAAMTDCTPRQVERALAVYRSYGIAGLLERVTSRAISPQQLDELRAAMSAGTLETLEEIRAWVEERFGLRYTTRGIGKLVQREFGARRGWVFGKDDAKKKESPTADAMIRFLNSLEVNGSIMADIDNIRAALCNILPDIDRASLYVSITTAYDVPLAQKQYLNIVDIESSVSLTDDISMELYQPGAKPSELLIEHFTSQGMPVHQYNSPAMFDYYNNNDHYIGSILLWTYTSKAIPSKEAIDLLMRLRPFIVYLLTIHQERYDKRTPTNIAFHKILDSMGSTSGLSNQECRVITLRLLGHSYQSIADSMHIARSTVHKHLNSIHRKTRTSSIVELFAKYFTPGREAREKGGLNEE